MAGKYNRKDHLYHKAKDEGFRSRAAYKLLELQQKYQLIRASSCVLDLGCWPGGWVQVAARIVRSPGRVVGVDLKATDPFSEDTVVLLQGDVRDSSISAQIAGNAPKGFDVVLSDMSPHLTGIREVDSAATADVAALAISAARTQLARGGSFVCKVFKNPEVDGLLKTLKKDFQSIQREELDASRSTSNEYYMVCRGFQKPQVA